MPKFSKKTATTKPPVIVDTNSDDKEVSHKDSDAKRILAEYDKGAFNPEQIAEKFNTDPKVVVEIIDRRTQEKEKES